MKEHPILFSGPMVRAIMDGKKTQTRRVIKPQPPRLIDTVNCGEWFSVGGQDYRSPYAVGMTLWVRETWAAQKNLDDVKPRDLIDVECGLWYRADAPSIGTVLPGNLQRGKWRPSIHMPRWASRITLEVTSVRVERVQDISEEDAAAEGCEHEVEEYSNGTSAEITAGGNFRLLWNTINEKRGYGWDANPWVWAITFKRI